MSFYDHTIDFFPEGKEKPLKEIESLFTPQQIFYALVSENTYLRRKVDGTLWLGHLYFDTTPDEALSDLRMRRAFMKKLDDYGDGDLNIIVEYRDDKTGRTKTRAGTKKDTPEIQSYLEKYINAENQSLFNIGESYTSQL